jgi:predicted dienelactone hydrolase
MQSIRRLLALAMLTLAATQPAEAAMGLSQIEATAEDGPITLYYPTGSPSRTVMRGPFALQVAEQAPPARGNGRLVVVSHGSGGSPWVHHDLARQLVEAGFVVALPQHRGDNYLDFSAPGPDSWVQRPAEVSRAIDALGRDARFAPLLALDRVGAWGGSAGGHTALSLAGGAWSPANFQRHCDAHLAQDFQGCVGLFTRLTGGWADGLKQWAVRTVLRWTFRDDQPKTHHDARIVAVVAMVPLASDFDLASLARPRVPLALVTAREDRWLPPRWHSDRVLQACARCEHLADLPTAGHGAMLSPLPPGMTGLVGDLLNDPPGFDRRDLPALDRKVVDFFERHLLAPATAGRIAP